MQYSGLVVDKEYFSALSAECNIVFDVVQRLPQKIFRRQYSKYYAFEYGAILQESFALFLTDMAHKFSDHAVNYMTFEPDPSVYFNNYGFYGAASFESKELIDNYLKVMYRDVGLDSFRASASVGVFWGSSLEWGIFCDRISWELCLIGVSQDLDESIKGRVNCMGAAKIRNYISAAYHWKLTAAEQFLNEFTRNYSISG